MSAQEIRDQIKALPPNERKRADQFALEEDIFWNPAAFKEGISDIAADRVVDLATVVSGALLPQRTHRTGNASI